MNQQKNWQMIWSKGHDYFSQGRVYGANRNDIPLSYDTFTMLKLFFQNFYRVRHISDQSSLLIQHPFGQITIAVNHQSYRIKAAGIWAWQVSFLYHILIVRAAALCTIWYKGTGSETCRKIPDIRRTKSQNVLFPVLACSCLCAIYWSQGLSGE